jgi:hypothetical protein
MARKQFIKRAIHDRHMILALVIPEPFSDYSTIRLRLVVKLQGEEAVHLKVFNLSHNISFATIGNDPADHFKLYSIKPKHMPC